MLYPHSKLSGNKTCMDTEDEADAAEIQVKIRLPIMVSLNFLDLLNQPKNIIKIEQNQTENEENKKLLRASLSNSTKARTDAIRNKNKNSQT